MFLVTFMALLFWIATWLTIQIECEPFRRHGTQACAPIGHSVRFPLAWKRRATPPGAQTWRSPRPTWLTSKSERLFSAEAPRIRKGPQLQAAGLRPRN